MVILACGEILLIDVFDDAKRADNIEQYYGLVFPEPR